MDLLGYKIINPFALSFTNQMHFDCFHGHMRNLQLSGNVGEYPWHPIYVHLIPVNNVCKFVPEF